MVQRKKNTNREMALLLVYPVAPSPTSGSWEDVAALPVIFRLCSLVPPGLVCWGCSSSRSTEIMSVFVSRQKLIL